MRLLLVGPLPPPIGGARVLFSQFVEALRDLPEYEVQVVETWRPRESWIKRIQSVFKCWILILRKSRDVDLISFWASYSGSLLFSPLVWLAASLAGKPWQVRRFGSGMRKSWEEMSLGEKLLTRFLFSKADQVILETRAAVKTLKKSFPNSDIEWHGNFRPIPEMQRSAKDHCRRFVFLGKVISEKGVGEIIESAERFPIGAIEVDLYGPLTGEYTENDFEGCHAVRYCGIVPPDTVPDLLLQYDALLLPTRFSREGYPGVILEAYMAGIPVIVSDWPSLQEIVDHSSGILVKPGDPQGLFQAMFSLSSNPLQYQDLIRGVLRKRTLFSLTAGVDRFLDCCYRALGFNTEAD